VLTVLSLNEKFITSLASFIGNFIAYATITGVVLETSWLSQIHNLLSVFDRLQDDNQI